MSVTTASIVPLFRIPPSLTTAGAAALAACALRVEHERPVVDDRRAPQAERRAVVVVALIAQASPMTVTVWPAGIVPVSVAPA